MDNLAERLWKARVEGGVVVGADGVLVGTRFYASEEALVHPNMKAATVSAGGDDTLRNKVVDIVRGFDIWPKRYDIRAMKSATTDRWSGREDELRAAVARAEAAHRRTRSPPAARRAGTGGRSAPPASSPPPSRPHRPRTGARRGCPRAGGPPG